MITSTINTYQVSYNTSCKAVETMIMFLGVVVAISKYRNTDCCNAVFVEQEPAEHAANKIEGKRNGHTSAVRTSCRFLLLKISMFS